LGIILSALFLGGCSFKNYLLVEPEKTIAGPEATAAPTLSAQPTSFSRPTMQINPQKNYFALINTGLGPIRVRLNAQETPVTVNNFVYLAKNHFYDRTVFHRVVKNFMIQGGDPKGDGTGGPGYFFDDELFSGDYTRGTLAMANAGRNTNGSQFFIIHKDYQLPKNYVIFGKVTGGMDVVDKIATASVEMNAFGEESKPVSPVVINSVEIIEK
jgi:cyclophilin family peptidyl-prolyl cis-trans isomerase